MLVFETFQFSQKILYQLCALDHFKGYWKALETYTTGLNILSEYAVHGQKFHAALDQLSQHDITAVHVLAIYKTMIAKDKNATWRETDHVEAITDNKGELCGYLDAATPEQIVPLLDKLLKWTDHNLNEDTTHPLLVIAIFHAVFLQITPVETGSQKLCNMLTQIYMFKSGYTYTPYVPLDALIKQKAALYYAALKAYQKSVEDSNPDWQAWLEAFLPMLQAQAQVLQDKLTEEGKDLSHLPALSADIMAAFAHNERLSMKDLMKKTGGRRATLKLRLSELLDQGYLKRHGGGRSTWYALS